MANLTQLITTLKSAELGEQVRDAIADTLVAVNEDNIKISGDYEEIVTAAGQITASVSTATAAAGTATTKATQASNSASAAASSAETASTKAGEASASASAASGSASTATTKAGEASASATAASGSAATATTKAGEASSSASAASGSAEAAADESAAAAGSAAAASSSADNASDSEVVATTQASIATTKAGEAATAKAAAETAQGIAVQAKDDAVTAKNAAELAETNAETAETNSKASELASAASETAAAGSAATASTKAGEASASAAAALVSEQAAALRKSETQAIKDAAVLALSETTDEAEVIEARKGKGSLGEKIGEIDSQLAEKAKITDVNTQIAAIASGSPKGVYATLVSLQAAYPTGNANIYLVTADGKWYYWNGGAWTAGGIYQSTINPEITDAKSSTIKNKTFASIDERIEEIEKDSTVYLTNIVLNADVSTDANSDGLADSWYGVSALTPRRENGHQFWMPTTTDYNSSLRTSIPIIAGHKYFISFYQKNVGVMYVNPDIVVSEEIHDRKIELYITGKTTVSTSLMFYPRTAGVESSVGKLIVIDLTACFGDTKIPNGLYFSEILDSFGGFWVGSKYCNYIQDYNDTKMRGLRLLFFGDSLSDSANISEDGLTYVERDTQTAPRLVRDALNLNLKCYARSGATYKTQVVAGDIRKDIYGQVNMSVQNAEAADIVIVAMGVNDSTASNVGDYATAMTKTTLESLDRTLLYESIRWAFWKIKTSYPDAVCFTTIPLQYSASETSPVIIDAITKMAKRYNFKIIDGNSESGIVRDFEVVGANGRYLKDGLHPNAYGKILLKNMYVNKILAGIN